MNMKFVKISHVCLRGLIQLRNELVYYIASNKLLSELKNDERICSKCPQIRVCSLLSGKENELNSMYTKSIAHLTKEHKMYFSKWYQMLELEFSDYKQFESGDLLWWKSKEEMEATGLCVFDLRLEKKLVENGFTGSNGDGFSIDNFFLFSFKKSTDGDSVSSKLLYLKPNDMVLLTSQNDNQIGISQGFIKSIECENTRFSLLLDKNLIGKFDAATCLFRIDKINFRSSITLNYTNLARLISSGDKYAKLRSFIVDKKIPDFLKELRKKDAMLNKHILKLLNRSQQQAIFKVL